MAMTPVSQDQSWGWHWEGAEAHRVTHSAYWISEQLLPSPTPCWLGRSGVGQPRRNSTGAEQEREGNTTLGVLPVRPGRRWSG